MKRGLFVTFEGSEGCGKSTQIRHLAAWLERRGKECVTTREPGGTPAGDEIRHLLQHAPQGHGLVPEAELLLFAASRAQLVRELVLPALETGKVVVSDRFHDSTTVYQGVARKLIPATVAAIALVLPASALTIGSQSTNITRIDITPGETIVLTADVGGAVTTTGVTATVGGVTQTATGWKWVVPRKDTRPDTARTYLSLYNPAFTLQPGKQYPLIVLVTVPAGTTPGVRYAGVDVSATGSGRKANPPALLVTEVNVL